MDGLKSSHACVAWTAKINKENAVMEQLGQTGERFTYVGNGALCPGTSEASSGAFVALVEHDRAYAIKITQETGGTIVLHGAPLVTVGAERDKQPPHHVEELQVSVQTGEAAGTHCWLEIVPLLVTPDQYNVAHLQSL